MRFGGRLATTPDLPAISLLGGLDRINEAIGAAMADAARELPAIQPYDGRSPADRLARSLGRDQSLLDRGGRIRTPMYPQAAARVGLDGVTPRARIRSRGMCPHRQTGGHAGQREPGAARLFHRAVGDPGPRGGCVPGPMTG